MPDIRISEADTSHIPFIRNIAMAAWPVTYSAILSASQIEYMLATIYHPATLQKEIEAGTQQFLLAWRGEEAVGFAAFGPQPEAGTYKLFKLYVRPDIQQSGAGKSLLAMVVQKSKAAGMKRLILNVHRSNPAIHFYQKQGFRIYETIDIPFGPGFVLNDYLMEKK